MKLQNLFLGLGLSATLFACQKGGPDAQKAQEPAAAATAESGASAGAGKDMRIPGSTVVAKWNAGQLTYGELIGKREAAFTKLRNKYLQDMYRMEQQELEGFVVDSLLEKAAAAAGKTKDQYMQDLAGAPSVTEEQIKEFYDKNVAQTGQPFDQIKDRIKSFLEMQQKQEGVKKAVDKLKADNGVELTLPPPETAKAKFDLTNRPFKGPKGAKVTIVEFSDFQCPYCSRAVPELQKVLDAYPNDVAVYFLHYPLNFHQQAMPAAVATECANRQGKFWEMHDKIFEAQANLAAEPWKNFAQELGLNVEQFNACLADPAVKEFVNQDMKQGETAGVEGTPSFFINGVQFQQGVPTVDAVKPYLNQKG
jgi:protein-disulfide isomerase